ncbi:helix-turn-helix transcriptional regulator [Bengtsoniella intestinalis]|uniref:helix-turn-helix domain-containing protein n=1 Tax=Bengtsoniella intestinalis TaxID=3073143 RepID=UPI00391FAAD3
MKLNKAVSMRVEELLKTKSMTAYQLHVASGIGKSSIGNVINCKYPSVKLRIIHEICQGLDIELSDFFNSPLFDEGDLEP